MPRPGSNSQRHQPAAINQVGQRLARKANGNEDPRRMKLLSEILDESSSAALNDVSSQQLGPRQVAENHSRLLDLLDELRQIERDSNPPLPSRSEESWDKFFEWVDEKNGTKLSDKVEVRRQRVKSEDVAPSGEDDDEYTLVAKVAMTKGDIIFDIERSLALSTETSSRDVDLNAFIKKDSIASGMQNVVLVLHLLNEYSKRERSFWWPYLCILPGKVLPILRSSKQSLAQYLLASAHIYEALKLLRSIARQYSYFYQRLHSTKLPIRRDFTFEYYTWGVSCVCSRQNEIPLSGNWRESRLAAAASYHSVHALIPVLDMCNHEASSSQAICLENSSRLVADKNFGIGDEITINYGCQSRSSGEFYIHNGFVPEHELGAVSTNGRDESAGGDEQAKQLDYYDVVPLTIGLSKGNKLYEKKAKLLKILNMPAMGRFKLVLNTPKNRHKHDPHLSMFLIVYSLNEQELDAILADPNPVGVADEIYEFVHYTARQQQQVEESALATAADAQGDEQSKWDPIKRRVAKSVADYLSLRCGVSIALIDRTLEEAAKSAEHSLNRHAARLLLSERRIFESYKRA